MNSDTIITLIPMLVSVLCLAISSYRYGRSKGNLEGTVRTWAMVRQYGKHLQSQFEVKP